MRNEVGFLTRGLVLIGDPSTYALTQQRGDTFLYGAMQSGTQLPAHQPNVTQIVYGMMGQIGCRVFEEKYGPAEHYVI